MENNMKQQRTVPITIARNDCINRVCDALNESGLPAFAKVDLMERILAELRPMMDAEYRKDLEDYRAAEAAARGAENADADKYIPVSDDEEE